jgi:hypothetical protein
LSAPCCAKEVRAVSHLEDAASWYWPGRTCWYGVFDPRRPVPGEPERQPGASTPFPTIFGRTGGAMETSKDGGMGTPSALVATRANDPKSKG